MSPPPKKDSTPSIFSVASNSSSKPLLSSNKEKSTSDILTSQNESTSKSQKLFQKTKSLLSSVGEHPSAKYDREQEALGNKPKVDRYGNSVDGGTFTFGDKDSRRS
ncbi:hypothetical protein GLAREA_12348 [Glarea lozoyensis ATCC 20868]|uniref:Uncharacterized protein n=1 Tax=Glarea lozoyensis (strain ATCC 20868 / MF5171) TaxID=1116229 RepID=S3CZ93_GLAL2|nr:uncharacterized protein GLAREA_12348 [Glarea lozoyensis ATCC 20868]EPE31592.1 hypothetical protein GLAREA_12348 [Glarea lozoyensis ATCC 20868]